MQVSITSLLYVIALALLAGLRPIARYLYEAISLVFYAGFVGIGYVLMWVVVNLQTLIHRRRPGCRP